MAKNKFIEYNWRPNFFIFYLFIMCVNGFIKFIQSLSFYYFLIIFKGKFNFPLIISAIQWKKNATLDVRLA